MKMFNNRSILEINRRISELEYIKSDVLHTHSLQDITNLDSFYTYNYMLELYPEGSSITLPNTLKLPVSLQVLPWEQINNTNTTTYIRSPIPDITYNFLLADTGSVYKLQIPIIPQYDVNSDQRLIISQSTAKDILAALNAQNVKALYVEKRSFQILDNVVTFRFTTTDIVNSGIPRSINDYYTYNNGGVTMTKIPQQDTVNLNNSTPFISFYSKNNHYTLTIDDIPDDIVTTQGLQLWDMADVTSIAQLFIECSMLEDISSLSSWDTSSVQTMTSCFAGCSMLEDISSLLSWDYGNVSNMQNMFENCASLDEITGITQDLFTMFQDNNALPSGGTWSYNPSEQKATFSPN